MNRKEKRMIVKANKSNNISNDGITFAMSSKNYNENIKIGEEVINRFISEKEEDFEILKLYNRLLNTQAPTDLIQISKSDYDKLLNRFNDHINNDNSSTDIILSGLVSLLDIEIEYDDEDGEDPVKTRVVIGEKYQELIKLSRENNTNPVIGCIMVYNNIFNYIYPITLNSNNYELLTTIPFPSNFNNKFKFDKDNEDFKVLTGLLSLIPIELHISSFSLIYNIWRIIQISMLHPILKNIYSNSSLMRKEICPSINTKGKNKNKKKKIVYCKKHIITDDKIGKVLDEHKASHKNQRHEMLWYVAGHWRTYKDGRKIFIKPHWRGPLRNSKEKIEIETRERVIPIEEKNED